MNVPPTDNSRRQILSEPSPAVPPVPDALPAAPVSLGALEVVAAAAIVLGWFGLATLVTDYGAVTLRFHFYNLWTVLANPTRLLTGMQQGDGPQSFAFGLLCLLVGLGILLPLRIRQRNAWLAYLGPLALMLVCGVLLYHESTVERFADSGNYGSLGSQAVQLANAMSDRMSAAVGRRISLGAGAYLAFAGCLLLAARGLQRYRASEPANAALSPTSA